MKQRVSDRVWTVSVASNVVMALLLTAGLVAWQGQPDSTHSGFYATVAQIIPVLLIAGVIEASVFKSEAPSLVLELFAIALAPEVACLLVLSDGQSTSLRFIATIFGVVNLSLLVAVLAYRGRQR